MHLKQLKTSYSRKTNFNTTQVAPCVRNSFFLNNFLRCILPLRQVYIFEIYGKFCVDTHQPHIMKKKNLDPSSAWSRKAWPFLDKKVLVFIVIFEFFFSFKVIFWNILTVLLDTNLSVLIEASPPVAQRMQKNQDMHLIWFKKTCILPLKFGALKGQSHEKVGEMRVKGDGLGPN
jgi:hypothetical protein